MKTDLHRASLQLQPDYPHTLRGASGTLVSVLWGAVWITEENDPQDYVLSEGHSHVLRSDGLTVIHALEATALSLLAPCADAAFRVAEGGRELAPATEAAVKAGAYLRPGIITHYHRRATRLHDEALQRALSSLGGALRRRAVALWRNLAASA